MKLLVTGTSENNYVQLTFRNFWGLLSVAILKGGLHSVGALTHADLSDYYLNDKAPYVFC